MLKKLNILFKAYSTEINEVSEDQRDLDSLVDTITERAIKQLDVGDKVVEDGDNIYKINLNYEENSNLYFDYEDDFFSVDNCDHITITIIDPKYIYFDAIDRVKDRYICLGHISHDEFRNGVRRYIYDVVLMISQSLDVYESVEEWVRLTLE